MNNLTFKIGTAALAVVATTALVAGVSSASGFMGKGMGMFSSENREAVDSALEARDYEAWQEAVGDNRMSEQVTAENFDSLAEAHAELQAGNVAEAKAILSEAGIEHGMNRGWMGQGGNKMGAMMGGGRGIGMHFNEAAATALDNEDFAAWQEAVGASPIADNINAENFDRLVEAHRLHNQARDIMNELGIEMGMHRGF